MLTILPRWANRAVVLATMLAVGATTCAQSRPVTKGLALAFPEQESIPVSERLSIDLSYEIRIPADLTVSKSGTVRSISFPLAEDSVYRGTFDSLLMSVDFFPGMLDGNPTDQILPMEIALRPGATLLNLISPVTKDSIVTTSASDYASALAINNIVVPKLQKLGSYGFPGMVPPSAVALPMIVAKLSLSQSGGAKNVEIVRSTIPSQNDQIQSLLNWATFAIEKKAPASTGDFYVAFVFHPSVSFPTRPISAALSHQSHAVSDFLIQILPDTLGLLVPPLPHLLQCDSVPVAEAQKKLYGRIAIELTIDSAGAITINRISRKERPARWLVDQTIEQLKFHPALGFDGKPRDFRGLLYVDFEGSAIVRVHPLWLMARASRVIR